MARHIASPTNSRHGRQTLLGETIEHPVVFVRQIDRQLRLAAPVLHRLANGFQVTIQFGNFVRKGGIRADMHRRVEFLLPAGRVVRHAVPQDLVDPIGQDGIGQELEIGWLLPLPIQVRLREVPRDKTVDARKRLGTDDGFAGDAAAEAGIRENVGSKRSASDSGTSTAA